jgi:signal transduction histidine kinase
VIDAESLALLHLGLSASATVVRFLLALFFESLKADALGHLEAANQALALARDQAEAATRAKSDFLATMSHEIRTPIHGIFGMTELALDTTDDARQDFLHRARACAETLLAIINDVLDFSRIEAGRSELKPVEFDPAALVEGVLDTLATQAQQKGLELLGGVGPRMPARLHGDAGRLRQILVNLVGNAVKFTARGEVIVRLDVEHAGLGAPGPCTIRGTVRDTGMGIPAEEQAVIFDAFTQVNAGATNMHGGTGLGLAITRRLAALMGGTTWVESAPGVGSEFGFTVRFEVAAAPGAPQELPALAGARFLVVESSPAARAHVAELLRAEGAEVAAVADVREASGLAQRGVLAALDAVVVGVAAGDAGDGAAAGGLRRVSALATTPVVALRVSRRGALPAPGDGFVAVVPKPVKRGRCWRWPMCGRALARRRLDQAGERHPRGGWRRLPAFTRASPAPRPSPPEC